MTFQTLDLRECQFLDLVNDDNNLIELSYANGRSWLKYFGHSNSLCVRAMRAIINYAPIREYQLRFFPREDFSCLCRFYLLELRHHILHECRRFNKYWNLRKDTISHFILFLEFNSSVFAFGNAIT